MLLKRKFCSLFVLLVVLNVTLISDEVNKDSWLSTGYESVRFIENRNAFDSGEVSVIDSVGINLTGYIFEEGKNVGRFISDSFLFTVNGITVEYSDEDIFYQIGIAFGPAYKKKMFNNLLFKTGLGFSIFQYGPGHSRYSSLFFNLGIAGDVGFKYDINDTYYLDIGTKIGYDALNMSIMDADGEGEFKYTTNYQMIRFAPYIGFGLNFYNNNGKVKLR